MFKLPDLRGVQRAEIWGIVVIACFNLALHVKKIFLLMSKLFDYNEVYKMKTYLSRKKFQDVNK